MGLPTFYLDSWNFLRKKKEKINFTYKQYFLLYKTSIKLLFCKDTYIIAKIQRVGNPERRTKLQNSSAKVSRNYRKTFWGKKQTKLAWVLWSEGREGDKFNFLGLELNYKLLKKNHTRVVMFGLEINLWSFLTKPNICG